MEGLALELLQNQYLGRALAVSSNRRNLDSRSAQYFLHGKEPVAGKLLGKKDGEELRHVIRPITFLKKYQRKPGAKLVCKICGAAHAQIFLCFVLEGGGRDVLLSAARRRITTA
jgi:hypothetical protein